MVSDRRSWCRVDRWLAVLPRRRPSRASRSASRQPGVLRRWSGQSSTGCTSAAWPDQRSIHHSRRGVLTAGASTRRLPGVVNGGIRRNPARLPRQLDGGVDPDACPRPHRPPTTVTAGVLDPDDAGPRRPTRRSTFARGPRSRARIARRSRWRSRPAGVVHGDGVAGQFWPSSRATPRLTAGRRYPSRRIPAWPSWRTPAGWSGPPAAEATSGSARTSQATTLTTSASRWSSPSTSSRA